MKDFLKSLIARLPIGQQRAIGNILGWLKHPTYVGILVPDTYAWSWAFVSVSRLLAFGLFWRRRLDPPTISPERKIDLVRGYVVADLSQEPEIQNAIHACREVAADVDLFDVNYKKNYKEKPYLLSYYIPFHNSKALPIFELACHALIIDPIADYLGEVPILQAAVVLYSPNKELSRGSQLFHMDGGDYRLVKTYIFIDDVTDTCGPLTIVPADQSRRIYNTLRRAGKTRVRNKKLDDGLVLGAVRDAKPVPLCGPSGTVAFVDTTRCYHYGSRPSGQGSKPRFILHLYYTTAFSLELPIVGKSPQPVMLSGQYTEAERRRHQSILGFHHLCYPNLADNEVHSA